MELLNLDSLVGPKRQIGLGGKTYNIAEQSVGQMIEAIRMEKAIKEADDPEMFLTSMKNVVREILPDMPEFEVNRLSFRQINAIIEFSNASDKEVIEGSELDTGDSEKKS